MAPSRFSSSRERRYWIWTLVVVVAIYSTLGLTARLANAIGNQRLLENLFFWTFTVLVGGLVWVALRGRPRGVEIAAVVCVGAVYVMLFFRISLPAERSHLFEYGLVAVLIYEALLERQRNGYYVPRPALVAMTAGALIGAVDELIQLFLPSRVFDVVDIWFNSGAAFMSVAAVLALRRVRHWRQRYPPMTARSARSSVSCE